MALYHQEDDLFRVLLAKEYLFLFRKYKYQFPVQCTMHSLQSKCAYQPFTNPLVLKLRSVCHWAEPMTITLKVPSQALMVSKKLMGTVPMQLVHCAQETMISMFWYLFPSMKAVVFFHDWISLNSIPVQSKSEEWKLC